MSNVIDLGHHRDRDLFGHEVRRERRTPASVEIEQELLGAILLNPDAYSVVSAIVRTEHFFEDVHRRVFEAVEKIAAAGQTPTYLNVRNALGATANVDLGGVSVSEYLQRLARSASTVLLAPEYARAVRDYWALREIESAAMLASDGAGYVASEMLSKILDRVDEIRATMHEREKRSATVGQAAGDLVGEIGVALRGEQRKLPWTGLSSLDDALGGGLQPGTLITCAGRTGMGKSVFGIEVADSVARQGFGVVYHTLEMSRAQVTARIIASRLERQGKHLPYSRILRHHGLDSEADAIAGVAHDLRGDPLRIEDGGGITIGEIAATSERRMNAFAKRGVTPGLVVIDHAHIVRPSRKFNREDEGFKEVADGSLALAKHLGLPVLLLAQCNRNTESREDKRPSLADVRGAGAFEEDSDAVLFLYRPAYYIERSAKFREGDQAARDEHHLVKNDLELIIDKNRLGQSNQVLRLWTDVSRNVIRNKQMGG